MITAINADEAWVYFILHHRQDWDPWKERRWRTLMSAWLEVVA